jgi:hydroxylamine dehydrogenase
MTLIPEHSRNSSPAFPDLFNLPDEPGMIEKRLYDMFYEHRMKTFQGALHSNPDYVNWYGLTNMMKELTLMKILDREMRRVKR